MVLHAGYTSPRSSAKGIWNFAYRIGRRGFLLGLIAGPTICWLIATRRPTLHITFPTWLVDGLIGGSICGLLSGMFLGLLLLLLAGWFGPLLTWFEMIFSKDKSSEFIPEQQDIWHSAGRNVLVGLSYGIVGGLLIGLIEAVGPDLLHNYFGMRIGPGLLHNYLGMQISELSGKLGISLLHGLGKGLAAGAVIGVLLALLSGGNVCVKYIITRILITIMNVMREIIWTIEVISGRDETFGNIPYVPWNSSQFLDYAVEHFILRKVERGYIFIDPLLQEFLSEPFSTVILTLNYKLDSADVDRIFEPLLRAIAAVVDGDSAQQENIEVALADLEMLGSHLRGLVQCIWKGESNLKTLTEGLDGKEKRLVHRLLEIINRT